MTAPSSVAPAAPHPVDALRLRRRTLPYWAVPGIVSAAILASLLLRAMGVLSGTAQVVLVSAALAALAVAATSAVAEGRRRCLDRSATMLVVAAFLLAVLPLASLLSQTVLEGVGKLTPYFLTHSMNGVGPQDDAGGIYHALLGTLEQVALASLMAVPIGVLTAIYLAEYGRGPLARVITFFVDVMTGIPSIVAGLFILSAWILGLGMRFSGFAGSLALAILMLPVVVRSAEEMIRLVPNELREASLSLGVPRWRTILKVVVPTAFGGLVTGVMLAIARITGETAPLLLVVFGADAINGNPFAGPQSALPLFIYQENAKGLELSMGRAWGAALALIAVIMLLSLGARLVARRYAPARGH